MIRSSKTDTPIVPHSRPTLGPEEIQQVTRVLESGQIAQGELVAKFETAFAQKLGTEYAVCVSSGTAALHLTLLALKIGYGDEVIIPSYVCPALLNALNYVGATPVLAEIDPHSYNLDPDDVKKRLTKRSRAVIVPHLFGLAADLESLSGLGVPLIEDCAQAVGACSQKNQLGTLGEAAIFSFYATKVLTTGEGGMIVSRSKEIVDAARDLREYDKTEGYKIRFNYKMTDIQAGIGLSQLDRLESFIRHRRRIAQTYHSALASLGVRLPFRAPGHIYFRYVIGLGTDATPWIRELRARGIRSERPVHRPIHRYLRQEGYPLTDQVWSQSLSIPIYPSLTEKETDLVIQSLNQTSKEVRRAKNFE
ncbi:MAG: DegT/DnrJ/EryC1/StrS aminotransferase family protein [Desulfobacterales bacterium]